MKSQRYALWQKLAVLAPLAVLLVSLPGQSLLRCRIDGSIRQACCCPADDAESSPLPVMNAQGCCDREVTASGRPPFEAARSDELDFVPTPSVAALIVAPPVLSSVQSDRTWRNHGPPREGPTLILLKHAFLI